MKKYTQEEYEKEIYKALPESNFSFVSYSGTEQPCTLVCLSCGKTLTFSNAQLIKRRARRNNKNVCRYCEENNWTERQKLSKKKAQFMLEKKGSIELVEGLQTWSSREPCLWRCNKCNHTFMRSPYVMFNQNGLHCPWCETRPYQYSDDMLIQEAAELWGDEYSILDTLRQKEKNGSKRILVCHNVCGFKYNVNAYKFLQGQGCPRCRASRGEWRVRNYLKQHNLIFQEQYVIHVDPSRCLKLDFYLEQGSKKFGIEYNGIQHYQPVAWFGGEVGFLNQKERDKLKAEYCAEHNIELIIIPYNDESLLNSNQLVQRLNGQAI